ncbi:MAG: heliorhodopsin HeR [Thermotogaceae bacterium]|jgi:hypothetical protein|nr:heliorhodopsin HeR [Mesotoga sp.]MDI9375685.1 heliorhodopsin HeR [Thermotogota bacterium]NLX33142.1 heliorhodopsin HeR [Thermotogaceae bacterium]MDD4039370.1 heliorhodopsin HeR [Mesotoga sp.]MDD4479487.1 heliorhodopsin HeR [Mesotoga sp.]
MENVYKKLRVFNMIMAFLHLIQGVVMLILSNDSTLTITRNYLAFDREIMKLVPATENLMNLRMGPFIASFLFMSSIAHFIVSTFGFKWYAKNLERGINYARWYEYSISSSVMIVALAMFSGMLDIVSLMLLFTVNGLMNLFGLMMELHNQTTGKTDWTSFMFGCVAGAVSWVAVFTYLFTSLGKANVQFPSFVYAIIVTFLVFFNSFAINMFLQYKKIGPWKNYLFGENVYIILSLVSKSLLAWQVFAGTLRPV